ncbi:MAG: hypothetical protein R6U95_10355, partial [Bacteroidales bacterium]
MNYLKKIINYLRLNWLWLRKNKPNYIVFAVFFGISTFFWLLNAFAKVYTLTVPYTIEYTNIPENFTTVKSAQQQIMVTMKGSGYMFLKYYMYDSFFVIPVDSEKFISDTSKKIHHIEINTEEFAENNISRSAASVIDISPKELENTISIITKQKIPVLPNVNILCEKNYSFVDSLTIEPDSIMLEGAKVILDTLQYIETEFYERQNAQSSFSVSLNVVPIPGIRLYESNIELSATIDKKLIKITEVPIDFSNVPKEEQQRISESQIIVSYSVFSSQYSESIDTSIHAIAKYSRQTQQEKTIPVALKNVPEQITILSVQP